MSKIEEKLTLSPPVSHAVSPSNQSDLEDVDSSAPSVDKKWVQAELRNLDPYLDLSHGEVEVLTVGRDLYYLNVILFVQHV